MAIARRRLCGGDLISSRTTHPASRDRSDCGPRRPPATHRSSAARSRRNSVPPAACRAGKRHPLPAAAATAARATSSHSQATRRGQTPAGRASRWPALRPAGQCSTRRGSHRSSVCSAAGDRSGLGLQLRHAHPLGCTVWPMRCASRPSAAAVVHQHLAAQQVQALDAVRALVDHVEAVVAPVLLDRKVARVAVAAVHLDREVVRLEAPLARPALRDRRQHLEQSLDRRHALGGSRPCFVDQPGAIQLERQPAFHVRLLREQHALHVGVLDDAHRVATPDPCRPASTDAPACDCARSRDSPRSPRSRCPRRRGRRRCAPRSSCGTCT